MEDDPAGVGMDYCTSCEVARGHVIPPQGPRCPDEASAPRELKPGNQVGPRARGHHSRLATSPGPTHVRKSTKKRRKMLLNMKGAGVKTMDMTAMMAMMATTEAVLSKYCGQVYVFTKPRLHNKSIDLVAAFLLHHPGETLS